MSQYFPKLFNSHFGGSIKFKIELSNYATKTDLKKFRIEKVLKRKGDTLYIK